MLGRQEYQPKLFSMVQMESLIPKNHLLRRLDEVLDFGFVRELAEPLYCKNNGRPSIDPEVFVRMLVIEYLYDIPSDRQLCEELGFNLAYRWFCRFSIEDDIPDHSSMTRIRDRLGEKTFKKIFMHVIRLCEEKGLVKGKRVITDGSLFLASAALKSLEERKSPESTETTAPNAESQEPASTTSNAMAKTETSMSEQKTEKEASPENKTDKPEGETGGDKESSKSKYFKGKTFSNKTHISKTDPDATLAGKQDEPKKLRYKLHQTIDADHRVIIDCHITTGSVPDGNVYADRLKEIQNTLGYKIEEASADRGYGSGENLQFLKDNGINSYVPRFHKDVGEKNDREKTPYDVEKNEFRCELGNRLEQRGQEKKSGYLFYRPVKGTCDSCERRSYCPIKRGGLRAHPLHQVQYETQVKEKTEDFRSKMKERMWKIEGLFGEAKNHHGLSRARCRGRWKVQVQAYLIASVQNIKRLMEAVLSLPGGDRLVREVLRFFGKEIFFEAEILHWSI